MKAHELAPYTCFILARHGESDANAAGLISGQSDAKLTEKGRRQARALAEFLARHENIDLVVTSDLVRAAQTASIVSEHLSRPLITDAALREFDVGTLSGLTPTEVKSKLPELLAALSSGHDKYAEHGGESLVGFAQRIGEAFRRLANQHGGRRMVLITHGGVINKALQMVLDLPPRSTAHAGFFALGNCAPTKLVIHQSPEGRRYWRIDYVGMPLFER